jgi:hypothetical protein
MHYRTSVILNFVTKLLAFENRHFCTRTVWSQGVLENPIQIIYRHLPIRLRIRTGKSFFKDATQKSARVVQWGIAIAFVPREPIFEKCSHLREKGGVLTLKTPRGVCAYPYCRTGTPAWVDGLLYSIGRSPDSVDHEPPHEDTKIRFLRIQFRRKMDFPCINKVDI